MKFCTVCGEWFDGTATAMHCPRQSAEPPPAPAPLPHGDCGTVWPVPERPGWRSALTGELAPVRTMAEYQGMRERQEAQAARHERDYSEDLPTGPGYYVYRLWGAGWSESGSLYVGMTGENGPRRLGARLAEHRRTKSWWHQVERIDATTCTLDEVGREEAFQIARWRPEHNRRTEGRKLTPREAEQAQGWCTDDWLPWREAAR